MKPLPALPPSATDLPVSLLGLAAAYMAVGFLRYFYPDMDPIFAAIFVMAAAAAPTVIADLFVFHRWREPAANLTANKPINVANLVRKCYGLLITVLSFAALYYIAPEYHRDMYSKYWDLVFMGLPFWLIVTPFYFYWCLRRDHDPHDAYDEVALLALGQIKGRDWWEIGRHYRNWLVKAFFMPLMISYMIGSTQGLIHAPVEFPDFQAAYQFGHAIIMFADLLYAAIGYVVTLRILNAHIRSSEPTFRGWVVAIACYTPFWDVMLFSRFFDYSDEIFWYNWLENYPVIEVVWGCAILGLLTVYSLATVCLGIRFSNLTYRGLITSGPYRFTKHPAYVTKNISWWLVSVPFLSNEGWDVALTHCALLIFVNVVYYLRARTEELHLSNYPEYVEYALAMNERSIFKPLVKVFPFLEYKVPANPPRI